MNANSFRDLDPDEIETRLQGLSGAERNALWYSWEFWAREEQLPPETRWRIWLILTGRGWGKTRTGAEYIRAEVEAGRAHRIAFVGATAADVRDVMVEGESGILAVSPPDMRPHYEPSKRRLTWPNGTVATTFSADKPDRLRGPQHDLAWADELAAWRYYEAWHMLMLGLRAGDNPRAVVTTTPKPVKLVRDLMGSASTAMTRGGTMENAANLAPEFLDEIIEQYGGTRLYRQEVGGEYLDEYPGAMWTRAMIDASRVLKVPGVSRVVVAVDPAVTSGDDSDETGIVVAALGRDRQGYVLADLTCRESPAKWAQVVVDAYENWGADRIIGEVNNGGDLVEEVIRTADVSVSYKAVHASRGKTIRAEPVAALYEQGKVHHVGGFDRMEDQMVAFTPDAYKGGDSPDRADALVYALTELMCGKQGGGRAKGSLPGANDLRGLTRSGMRRGSARR